MATCIHSSNAESCDTECGWWLWPPLSPSAIERLLRAYIVMACLVMAYLVMAYLVMAYLAMAYAVMVHI